MPPRTHCIKLLQHLSILKERARWVRRRGVRFRGVRVARGVFAHACALCSAQVRSLLCLAQSCTADALAPPDAIRKPLSQCLNSVFTVGPCLCGLSPPTGLRLGPAGPRHVAATASTSLSCGSRHPCPAHYTLQQTTRVDYSVLRSTGRDERAHIRCFQHCHDLDAVVPAGRRARAQVPCTSRTFKNTKNGLT